MTTLYDKNGNEVKVTHKIDVTNWINEGYTLENPKNTPKSESKKPTKKED